MITGIFHLKSDKEASYNRFVCFEDMWTYATKFSQNIWMNNKQVRKKDTHT